MADPRFKTGARRSPRHKLLAVMPFRRLKAPPERFALVPSKLDMWGNDQYGDCVSAEEGFRCACDNPEDFIPAQEVIRWARAGGFLDGAGLTDVMDAMKVGGFKVGANEYRCGQYLGVDYSNESVLQAALATGPVKIAISSQALPGQAGNQQGWSAFGGRPGEYPNTDHCVALCGYGPASWLANQLGAPVPGGAPAGTLYLLYTWSTIGIVDHDWLMSTCAEAWVRNPSTVIVGPEPQPTPPGPQPMPDPTPTPTPPNPPTPQPPAPSPWTNLLKLLIEYGPAILQFLISLLTRAHAALEAERSRQTQGRGASESGSTDRRA